MGVVASNCVDTGLEVFDLHSDSAFAERRLHVRDAAMQMRGMQRLAHAFVENPETILQELVNAAVELCGADSAGISLETEEKNEASFYRWVATAGQYAHFLNVTLPRYPSTCTMCLERGKPQLFRVSRRFYDLMSIEAPTVTDGIMLPWQVEEMRGTIWIMAHGRTEAFDTDDYRVMEGLADFAAMAVREQRHRRIQTKQATAAAAAAMANELAHQINNPLQSLSNTVFLAAQGGLNSQAFVQQASDDLARLSELVRKLLELPR